MRDFRGNNLHLNENELGNYQDLECCRVGGDRIVVTRDMCQKI